MLMVAATLTSCTTFTSYNQAPITYSLAIETTDSVMGLCTIYYSLEVQCGKYALIAILSYDEFDEPEFVGPEVTLSEGRYKRKGPKYYLHDAGLGYQMVLCRHGKNLYVEQSFPFLIGKTLNYEGKDESCYSWLMSPKHLSICRTWEYPLDSDANLIALHNGIYRSNFLMPSTIEFGNDGGYRYSIIDHLLSEGTWTRDGNYLTLQDTVLHYAIEAAIVDSTIITKAIPASRYKNLIFRYDHRNR